MSTNIDNKIKEIVNNEINVSSLIHKYFRNYSWIKVKLIFKIKVTKKLRERLKLIKMLEVLENHISNLYLKTKEKRTEIKDEIF